jgi:thioesterase domain-containing protein
LAFEAAQQLRRAGEAVASLLLLDSHAPTPLTAPPVDLASLEELVAELGPSFKDLPRARAERWLRVFQRDIEVLGRYAPSPYPGSALLLRAEDGPGDGARPADLGWGAWIEGRLTVKGVPGDHRSMLRAPHFAAVAEEMTRHLDAIDT